MEIKSLLLENRKLRKIKQFLLETNSFVKIEDNKWFCGEFFGTFTKKSLFEVHIIWDDSCDIPDDYFKEYIEELIFLSI